MTAGPVQICEDAILIGAGHVEGVLGSCLLTEEAEGTHDSGCVLVIDGRANVQEVRLAHVMSRQHGSNLLRGTRIEAPVVDSERRDRDTLRRDAQALHGVLLGGFRGCLLVLANWRCIYRKVVRRALLFFRIVLLYAVGRYAITYAGLAQ